MDRSRQPARCRCVSSGGVANAILGVGLEVGAAKCSSGLGASSPPRVRQAGVVVNPLSGHRQRPGPPGLVLGYAAHPPGLLRDAVRRIASVVDGS